MEIMYGMDYSICYWCYGLVVVGIYIYYRRGIQAHMPDARVAMELVNRCGPLFRALRVLLLVSSRCGKVVLYCIHSCPQHWLLCHLGLYFCSSSCITVLSSYALNKHTRLLSSHTSQITHLLLTQQKSKRVSD
jgi:hypothetical protein